MGVDELEGGLGAKPGRQRLEEGGVGFGIPEISAVDVGEREPLRRRHDPHGTTGFIQTLGDDAPQFGHLVPFEADQRRNWIVVVALPASILLREGLAGSLVEEVDTAGDDHLRQPVLPCDRQALRPSGVQASEQRVCDLRERVVDHARQGTRPDELLHRRTTDSVGVEDHRLVPGALERGSDPHHRRRRVSEHRDADAAPAELGYGPARVAHHPRDGRSGVVEDGARDRIEAENVDDRVHDENVALADEGTERPAAGRARRDDHLGHADRQRVHGRRAEQRALGAAETQHPVDPSLQPEPQADGSHALDHQLDSRAAASRCLHLFELIAGFAGDVLAGDVSLDAGLAEDAGIDHDRPGPERDQPVAHISDLVGLRVQRPDQGDPRLLRHDSVITPGPAIPACAPRPAPSGTPPAQQRDARRRARTSSHPSGLSRGTGSR